MENVDEMEGTRSVVSRRSFIKGVIASGSTVTAAGVMLRNGGPGTAQAQEAASGAVERMIRLTVNGQQRTVDVLDQETLAMTLRYKLNLPGTKLGCDRAECGCCTVMIDDVTHYACSILTHQVRGREVTTIEGLAGPSGELHPVQQAAMEEAGFQCAFCAPGFLMSMASMLKINAEPTRAEAAHALSGNLCRCGDYNKILNVAMRASEIARSS